MVAHRLPENLIGDLKQVSDKLDIPQSVIVTQALKVKVSSLQRQIARREAKGQAVSVIQ